MPSQLLTNEAISFIVGKTFTFRGVEYEYGDDFDQDVVRVPANNIETLVRNRYLIPVVDSYDDKPRHWYREIKLRSDVEAKMGLGASSEAGAGGAPPPAPAGPPEDYDPGEHTIREVKGYLDENPGELESIISKEENGQARSTLLGWLYDQRG